MGLFSWLFGKKKVYRAPRVQFLEGENFEGDKTMKIPIVKPKQRYVVKIDGEYQVYSRKADMPPELRSEIEEIERERGGSSSYNVFVDGRRAHFDSAEELPREIRDIIIRSDLK